MIERERNVVGLLVALMLLLWLGFLVHRSPGFPGSFIGSLIGIGAALAMLVPFIYSFIKRVPPLKRVVTRHVSMRTLLAWHIYAGLIGPLLGLVHSGHRFDSTLGAWLVFMMLVTVVSGFVGRHLFGRCSMEIRDKQRLLVALREQFDAARRHTADAVIRAMPDARAFGLLRRDRPAAYAGANNPVVALQLVEAIADAEYAIRLHEQFNRWFSIWLRWHIAISYVVLALIGAHVLGQLWLGLRWS